MVQPENQKQFEELISQMKGLFTNTTTSVKITITADVTRIVVNQRHPEQLKKNSVSMRNIQGDFIK